MRAPCTSDDRVVVTSVRFEYGDVALGMGKPSPRLSWEMRTEDSHWSQTAYEVELDDSAVVRVESAEQVLVPWPFEPLRSKQRASVRVRVASGDVWSAWSEPSVIEAGLLNFSDWSAKFVSPRTIGGIGKPAPLLFRTFTLRTGVHLARLYVTAHGSYEANINGHRAGDHVLAPGWTSYTKRLVYQTYDVTSLLREGENNIEMLLGNGWYRGGPSRVHARGERPSIYGEQLALLAQLEVTYADGSVDLVETNEKWLAKESNILENDLFDGQRTDLRPQAHLETHAVEIVDEDFTRLVAPSGPPARVTEVVPAAALWTAPSGATLVDFGQNLVGWVRLRVRNTVTGSEIRVRHGELLEDEELCVSTLASAKATDTYVLTNADELVLEPCLTFHGFRFAEITGAVEVTATDVEAAVVGSDLRRTGWFECSDPDLNRLHENVLWSLRGNFLSVPTDCPQRSERLGWTGDIQVFAPTASFLFDVSGFLSAWLADVVADQYPDGTVAHVVPNVSPTAKPAAGWGDVATVVPWVLYQRFGDTGILARQFDSMRAWVDKINSVTTSGLWAGGFQYGDWLDPNAPAGDPFAAAADPDVVATACFARSAEILASTARVLGKHDEAERYASLAERTRKAFADAYVTGLGRVTSDAATAYAMAIEWALLPTERLRECAGNRLADLVRLNGFRISTGFLGTPLICDALCSAGQAHLAYRLLLQRRCPSWLYPVTVGATTVWERWDGLLPDGSLNPGGGSLNHYALGAVADWLHRTVAGLAPAMPGYRHITVHPIPDPALTHASARHHTPYGGAAVSWRREDGQFHLNVTVPAGSRATVHLPGREPLEVSHGQHSWITSDPCIGTHESVSTVRDLIDVPRLWDRAVSRLVDNGLRKNGVEVTQLVARRLDVPASVLLPEDGEHQDDDDIRQSFSQFLFSR